MALIKYSSFLLLLLFLHRFTCESDDAITAIPQRNVLIILGDDIGFENSVYNNTVCATPNLQSLANEGVTFTRAYSSASSGSPSKASLLTGLPQHFNGMYGSHSGFNHFNSINGIKSLTQILKDANIRTGIVGKKDIGPSDLYPFDMAETEENNPVLQVGRNITKMKLLVREFLNSTDEIPFFLFISFDDARRCLANNDEYEYGRFCENFGNGHRQMGRIEDWKPRYFNPNEVIVPYFIPDTHKARMDIASLYTVTNRMDQGIGLILDELKAAGHADDTLIIFTSDNGISFPAAKTNFYEPGWHVPLIVKSPEGLKNVTSDVLVSHLDFVPTVLEWWNLSYPFYTLPDSIYDFVNLTGKSLLPYISSDNASDTFIVIFGSQNFHEATMYYPMRVARSGQFKLIHNINNVSLFPVDQDLIRSITFQDILDNAKAGDETHWYKTLDQYYKRSEWELYDLANDPYELVNVYDDPYYESDISGLMFQLHGWLWETNDQWLCSPQGVLEDLRIYPLTKVCYLLYGGKGGPPGYSEKVPNGSGIPDKEN